MMEVTLKTPLSQVKHIGPRSVLYLRKLGLVTVEDLLRHFPFRYDDFSEFKRMADLVVGETVSVRGEIVHIENVRTRRRRMTLTEAVVEDESGSVGAVWFNQPFLMRNLRVGVRVSLSGKVAFAREGLQLTNPAYEVLGRGGTLHTGALVPVYHETEGLSSKWLRAHLKPLLPLLDEVPEFLPVEILERQDFMALSEAMKQVHFPASTEAAEQAKRRLAFDELFLIQLYLLEEKRKWQGQGAVAIPFNREREADVKSFLAQLPFALTDGQRMATWKIIKDMERPVPMNRLLEGDVGSGKTLVALLAAWVVMRSGYQALMMAPTEILARQHFGESVKRLGGLEGKFRIALLTAGERRVWEDGLERSATKEQITQGIAAGKVDLVLGTHALIQEGVKFKRLALSVVDEQHRFGIEQRGKLQQAVVSLEDGFKKTVPHLLSMTATPIPRTLSLTICGDLDLSVLDELPAGRKSIMTKLVTPANRADAYEFIRREILSGRQAFLICPLIEDSDVLEVKSATAEYQRLQEKVFLEFKLGLLHGKLKSKEKERVMRDFSAGKTQLLVSTSVVEVGVDVPNANVMVIEGADRFGLAQLHQFRGRVGRGEWQSYCFLFTDSTAAKSRKRLRALTENASGFALAEMDLELRGPGELIGVRQSGLPDLAMASLTDAELIGAAKEEAEKFWSVYPDFKKHPALGKKLSAFREGLHLE